VATTQQPAPAATHKAPDTFAATDSMTLKLNEQDYTATLSSDPKQQPPPNLQPKKPGAPTATAPANYRTDTVTLRDGSLVNLDKPATSRPTPKFLDGKANDDNIAKRDSIEKRNMANIPAEVVNTKEESKSYGFTEKSKNANARKSDDMAFINVDKAD